MNNQTIQNQTINTGEIKRSYFLRTVFLSIVGLALAIFTMQVKAGTVETTVNMSIQGRENARAKITVFDAGNGRQIANGHTVSKNGNNIFVFTTTADDPEYPTTRDFVVVGMADGYIGSARGLSGSTIYVFGAQPIATMSFVHADADGDAILTFTNASGAPAKKATVTTVEWGSLGNARRGKTNAQGKYNFKDPKDLAGSDFLAVEWTTERDEYGEYTGEINLKAILTGSHTAPDVEN